MKTSRERRSSSGHASRCSGGWTTCWTPFRTSGPVGADVEQALDAQDVLPRACEQHRQPDAERGPVERLVERRGRARAPSWACSGDRRTRGRAGRSRAAEQRGRLDVAERRLDARRPSGSAGVSRAITGRRIGEVGLRDDEPVGGRRLLHATRRSRRPCCASTVVTTRLEPVVVLDQRLGEQRVDDRRRGRRGRWSRRRRAGTAGSRRASRRPSRSRSSSARSPRSVQQTQPLASSTVRSSTRRSRWWSMPTSPSSFTITAVSPMSGWASRRESSVVLPLPRNPVTSVTGRRHQRGARAPGRAGRAAGPRAARPPSRATPRSSTTTVRPLRSRSTYTRPPSRRAAGRSGRARG